MTDACSYAVAGAAWLAIGIAVAFGALALVEAGRQLRLLGFRAGRRRDADG